ncbi:MAG TPA: hypothetical protein VNV16_04080 [Methylibium sp.]|nr:hypothetical protein [Methylibium sp.]
MSCRATCHPDPAALADPDEGVPLPSAEALIAGTLALMTGVAERAALTQPLAAHAQSLMMSVKVGANLGRLAEHPQLSAPLRSTLARLQGHWERLIAPAALPAAEPDRRLWHARAERLQ